MYTVDFLDGLFGILGNQFPETMWEYRSIYVTLTWERKTPFSIGFYTPNGYFMCSREFSYWFANQPHEKRNNWSALIWLKLKRAIMHATYWVITYEGRGIGYPKSLIEYWAICSIFEKYTFFVFGRFSEKRNLFKSWQMSKMCFKCLLTKNYIKAYNSLFFIFLGHLSKQKCWLFNRCASLEEPSICVNT